MTLILFRKQCYQESISTSTPNPDAIFHCHLAYARERPPTWGGDKKNYMCPFDVILTPPPHRCTHTQMHAHTHTHICTHAREGMGEPAREGSPDSYGAMSETLPWRQTGWPWNSHTCNLTPMAPAKDICWKLLMITRRTRLSCHGRPLPASPAPLTIQQLVLVRLPLNHPLGVPSQASASRSGAGVESKTPRGGADSVLTGAGGAATFCICCDAMD